MTIKIVAGEDNYKFIQNLKVNTVPRNEEGHFKSESLCKFQEKVFNAGIVGAQIVKSNYGYSVRYDSGLLNWGLLASARAGTVDGSWEDAARFCREWVDQAPTKRYAWSMDYVDLGV